MINCNYHYGGGGRELRFYRAPLYTQAGAGFFGDLFRHVVPLITGKVAPYVGRRVFESGKEMISELGKGTGFRQALKSSAKRTLERGKQDLFSTMRGEEEENPFKRGKTDVFNTMRGEGRKVYKRKRKRDIFTQ